jgi:hypothetical protein
MSQDRCEVRGSVLPDGTLVLDERLPLPAGRVRVTIAPLSSADDPFWQRMQAIWGTQQTRGHVPRSKEQVDAELHALREEWAERDADIQRTHEEC